MKHYGISFFLTLWFASVLYSQVLTSITLPQYIEGVSGANSNRIPFAYRARLTGLSANTPYRYINQIINSSDAATTNGSGNCIFVSLTGDFVRTSSPSLATAGAYGTFSTDANGAYEGWFISEPTGNTRFVPGKYVLMRIALNDGASGTTVATRLTTADSVRVVKLDPVVSDSTGTGLRCTSGANPKDFVFAYDNTTGSGRPISGSLIESDGTDNSEANNYAAFYAGSVNGVNGAFGVVLPSMLGNGVRRIERRSLATGAVVTSAEDADGIWPSGANTLNPAGGTTAIILSGIDVGQLTSGVYGRKEFPGQYELCQNYPNPFNPTTAIDYRLPVTGYVTIKVYDLLGREVATLVNEERPAGNHTVFFSAGDFSSGGRTSAPSSGTYYYRITAGTFTESKSMMLLK